MDKPTNKIVAYYRVSTKKQGESGLGLDSQKTYIWNYFGKPDLELIEVKSGKEMTKRPMLQQAIKYCQANDAILVVAKLDRLSRNVDDCRWLLSELKGNLRSCDIPGIIDKFTLTIYAAFAERERELISIRTKNAKYQRKLRGLENGHKPNMTQAGRINGAAIRRREAEQSEINIRAKTLAIEMRQSGNSFDAIATHLNSNNFASPKGGKWYASSIKRLLNSNKVTKKAKVA